MYERLDKLRAEVKKLENKVEADKKKLKAAEERLKEAENLQILSDVGAMNLTPEQLAQFLKMMKDGRFESCVAAPQSESKVTEDIVSKNNEKDEREERR